MRTYQEIVRDGYTLRGMLHRPAGIEKIPMVVMLHGFGGNKLEKHRMFMEMSEMLEKKGIASVRFDFMGSGESDGEFQEMTLDTECADANAILDFVQALDFVDTGRIGLFGFSLGGVIATMIAARRSGEIHSLCLNAPGFSLPHGIRIEKKMGGVDIGMADRLGYFDYCGEKVGLGFIQSVRALNLGEYIPVYPGKTLIIHGAADPVVDCRFSRHYARLFQQGSLHLIAGADHHSSTLPQRKELYQTMSGFFAETLR